MKKIYLSALSLAIAAGLNAQQGKELTEKHYKGGQAASKPSQPVFTEKATVIWSDDFSDPSTWTMTNTSMPTSVDWSISTDPVNGLPNAAPALNPFASATASNGFAVISSDDIGGGDNDGTPTVAEITNVTAIDLTGYSDVILRFSHSYRWWQDTRGVRVSGDGGMTWTDFDITSAPGGVSANGYPDLQNSDNPTLESINISAAVANSNNVLVQFYYNDNDNWAWYWVVDDVEILERPTDDVQLVSAYFSGENHDGIEFGRTPIAHVDDSYFVGGQVLNFGTMDQTSVDLAVDYTSFSSSASGGALMSDSTVLVESMETPALAVGVYSGVYTASSNADMTGGPEFGDNVLTRNWEITENIFSVDGIGNHPAVEELLGTIGTGSFADAADGLVVAAAYTLKQAESVSGIRVMLDASTVAGGEIFGSLIDTATFWQNNTSPLFLSPVTVVTAADVSNGYVDVLFNQVESVDAGTYYAAVDLYSSNNSADIVIVDDQTIGQPARTSSIYIAGDQSYTNGVGVGIRLLIGDQWGAGIEENTLSGVSVYPNPSKGIFTITNDANATNEIVVYDMVGKVVYTNEATTEVTINLESSLPGVYLVEVSNETGSMVERVVIK